MTRGPSQPGPGQTVPAGSAPAGSVPTGSAPAGFEQDQVRELAERRAAARRARDFAAADELRDQILALGWLVADGADGYSLSPLASRYGPGAGQAGRGYQVFAEPGAIPPAPRSDPAGRMATVSLLVEGWPDDLRACTEALLAHLPPGVVVSGLDIGNVDGAGDVLHELAAASRGRIEEWHVAAAAGWGPARNALLRADPAAVHVLMETSTILTGDAIGPLLAALAQPDVVAAGWYGTEPDPDLLAFHEAGPGRVTALLGYLLAVRTDAAARAGGLPARARFYRNADLEFSLRLGCEGALVVPPGPPPVIRTRHRGYHDTDPGYRDAESRRNYRRVLDLLRSQERHFRV
jgi:hypothetical protein